MSAKIAIIGEAWGEMEAKVGHPFVGVSGIELMNMLHEAGIIELTPADRACIKQFWFTRDPNFSVSVWKRHPEVCLTNVFNLRPERNDIASLCSSKDASIPGYGSIQAGKFIRAEFSGELDRLAVEIQSLRPNLIIGLGGTAAWACIKQSGVAKIRGSICASIFGTKYLATYHPAAILRDWSLRAVTVLDLAKAKRESEFPEIRRPEREIWIEPSLLDMEQFYASYLLPAKIISFDIESAGDQITCIGFAPSSSISLVIPFTDPRKSSGSYWPTVDDECRAWDFVRRVLALPCRKVGQNLMYDTHFLWRNYGITVANIEDDTMLMHHALQPESEKGLAFLGSVYTNEASWKLMRPRGKSTIKADQ